MANFILLFTFLFLVLAPASKGAEISGTVYRRDGVTPIRGADITIFFVEHACGMSIAPKRVAVDPITGKYAYSSLEAGTYYLYAQDADTEYFKGYWATPQSASDCGESMPVTISAGEKVTGKDFQLYKAAKIYGTVYSQAGVEPLAGISGEVSLLAKNACEYSLPVRKAEIDTTDGSFELTRVPQGTYYLMARATEGNYVDEWWKAPGSVTSCDDASLLTVSDGDVQYDKDFHLDTGTIISGTVFAGGGLTPFSGTSNFVSVYSGSDCDTKKYVDRWAIDPVDGSYSIDTLAAGRYYLLASVSEENNYVPEWWGSGGSSSECTEMSALDVGRSEVRSGKDFQLDTGAIISGRVFERDGVTPITTSFTSNTITISFPSHILVYNEDPCKNVSGLDSSFDADIDYYIMEYVDGSSGAYQISSLPAGSYFLATDVGNYANYIDRWWTPEAGTTACSAATAITVEEGEVVADRDFQLDAGGIISGTIYRSDGVTPITEESIQVTAYTDEPCGSRKRVRVVHTEKSSGEYQVEKLPSGRYYLQAQNELGPYVTEWLAAGGGDSRVSCEAAQSIYVTVNGIVTGQNFQLNRGGSIAGVVFSEDGITPADGAYPTYVRAYRGNPCRNPEVVKSASVDEESGAYRVEGLPVGTYYLQADDNSSGFMIISSYGGTGGGTGTHDHYVNEWWAGSTSSGDCAEARPIEVGYRESVAGKRFQLSPVRRIPGDVDLDGEVTIRDAILSLQSLAGKREHSVWSYGDVDSNRQIGIPEVLFLLDRLGE